MKQCLICGCEFEPEHNAQRFCKKVHYKECPVCSKQVIWNSMKPVKPCCPECTNKKRAITNMRKYDCTNAMQIESTKITRRANKQREKHKLLSGQCPTNVLTDIDKELEIEVDKDGLIERFKFINLTLNKIDLIQNQTTQYNTMFEKKKIYIQNTEYLPENLLTQIKLYQAAVKRLCDNKQAELLEKVTLPILEKVFGNILKSKKIENILEYYITSLINELAK